MGIRSLLHKLRDQMDNPEYWSLQSPRERIADAYLRKLIGEKSEPWLYESKAVDFHADHAPVQMEDTVENFGKIYEAEKTKLHQLKVAVHEMRRSTKIRSMIHNDSHFQMIIQEIDQLEKELKGAWTQFMTKAEDRERPIYPDKVSSQSSGVAMSQAQVQVQQQQQQQQQVQQQEQVQHTQQRSDVIPDILEIGPDPYFSCSLSEAERYQGPQQVPWDLTAHDANLFMEAWDTLGIRTSANALTNFKLLHGFRGNLINARVFLERNQDAITATMLSKGDFHNDFNPILSPSKPGGAIISMVHTEMYPATQGFTVNQSQVDVETELNPPSPRVMEKVLLSKLYMGVDRFTEEEEAELRNILNRYPQCREGLLVHARNFGDINQEALIKRL